MLERELSLPDGRTLAYAEYGRPDGRPVFYFHGSPSSRLEPRLFGDETLARLGLRVLAPDRPGVGRSSFQPGRRITGWPADLAALADALRLDRFGLWGFSGGAPYVATCAACLPERITAAVVVSGGWRMDWPEATTGLPLPNRLMLFLARRAPPLLGLMFRAMAGMGGGKPEQELAQLKGRVADADHAWFAAEPARFGRLGDALREALRPGTRGAVHDMRLYVRPFGFELSEVRRPLALFHGDRDANAPLALARRAASELPDARLEVLPGEAHLSMTTASLDKVAACLHAN